MKKFKDLTTSKLEATFKGIYRKAKENTDTDEACYALFVTEARKKFNFPPESPPEKVNVSHIEENNLKTKSIGRGNIKKICWVYFYNLQAEAYFNEKKEPRK